MKISDDKKRNLISLIIAVALCAGLLIGTYCYSIPTKDENYKVVCLGDSILGNVRDETSVTSLMECEIGYKVFNGCFGGTCASLSNTANRRTYYEDSMNLVSIVNSIANNNYDIQYYDLSANNYKLPYFYETMKSFENVDFAEAELIFLEHGVNDYSAGRVLDDKYNPLNVYTYGGALRYSIEKLQKACPKAKIVLVTPTYCFFVDYWGESVGDCNTLDFGYGYLEDYANLQIEIAKEYGLDYIDNFHDIGIDETNAKEYTIDGIHLNEAGRKLLAGVLAEFTKETIN